MPMTCRSPLQKSQKRPYASNFRPPQTEAGIKSSIDGVDSSPRSVDRPTRAARYEALSWRESQSKIRTQRTRSEAAAVLKASSSLSLALDPSAFFSEPRWSMAAAMIPRDVETACKPASFQKAAS